MTTRARAAAVGIVLVALLGIAPAVWAAEEPVLRGLDGERLGWSDLLEGRWVVVFWASWSPRCRDIVPRVNAIEDRWGDRARVVTVNFQEEPESVRSFLRGKKLAVPVFLDPTAAFSKRASMSNLPGLLVYRDGERSFVGQLPRDPNAAIGRALGEPAGR